MCCVNLVALKLSSAEGFRLFKPISSKVANRLFIDDLKVFAASEAKLNGDVRVTKAAMEDIGLECNEKEM